MSTDVVVVVAAAVAALGKQNDSGTGTLVFSNIYGLFLFR